MPLIPQIGRKSLSVRVLIVSIYLVLGLGGITMLYPVLIMISGSLKGICDSQQVDVIPAFLLQDSACFRRYIESKYNASLAVLNSVWGTDYLSWDEVRPPPEASARQLEDFDRFRRTEDFPAQWYRLGHVGPAGTNQRIFRRELLDQSKEDLQRLNERFGMTFRSWVEVIPKQYPMARLVNRADPFVAYTDAFMGRRPIEDRVLLSVEAHWKTSVVFPRYNRSLETYRTRTGAACDSWNAIRLGASAPSAPPGSEALQNWEDYVRRRVPFAFLQVDPAAKPLYVDFLRRAYHDDLKALNKSYASAYRSFDEVEASPATLSTGSRFVDFDRFVKSEAPLNLLSLDGPDFRYRRFVEQRFSHDLKSACAAYGTRWKSFDEVVMPAAAMDWSDFQRHKGAIRWELAARNYKYVLDFLMRYGHGIQNTVILCILFLVTHLTINPLAAYALSRFNLPSTYKILLFCMATMAFPSEVMMIPAFLQLKELHLLNTFWALVLPSMANGYSIFLLKGFFDSLPRELYEAAVIDGAGEWSIFLNITLALSKPILAVMALGSFTMAYSAFFYALIICPDNNMWTLMVWLYHLQMISHSQSINYAALCLSSLPTLLVFVFCQRVILRGIVVPSEK